MSTVSNLIPQPAEGATLLEVSPFEDDYAALTEILRHSVWHVVLKRTFGEAIAFLKRRTVPVVMCECTLPDGSWRDMLERTERAVQPPALIVVSQFADDRLWSEVLNHGGYNVIMKPFQAREVLHDIGFAWYEWSVARTGKPRVAGGGGAC